MSLSDFLPKELLLVCFIGGSHVFSSLDFGETSAQLSPTQDVITTVHLFLNPFKGNLFEGHNAETFLLGNVFFARDLLRVVSNLVPLLFVLFSQIFLSQAFLVLNLHVDRVVHQSLAISKKNLKIVRIALRII